MEEDINIRKIRIFVAGSKKLQAKRDFVKRIVSEYNTKKFDLYMKPFFFYVYDYTSFYPAQRLNGRNITKLLRLSTISLFLQIRKEIRCNPLN